MLDAPQKPAWWFIAGDVIHKATEVADLENITSVPEGVDLFYKLWNEAIAKLKQDGVDLNSIRAGGRATKEFPQKENSDYWLSTGPGMVAGWITFRSQKFREGWQWYRHDNEAPGIELAVEANLQHDDDEVKVKGYLDRAVVDPYGQLHIWDLKSGSRQPASTLQLGVYKVAVEATYGVTPVLGSYYMTRTRTLTDPVALNHYTADVLGNWFVSAKRAIEAEVFIPKPSAFCNACEQMPYCPAMGGDESKLLRRAQS